MPYLRKKLPFNYDELEPFMDSKTVELHYEKHHKGYQDKLNEAIKNKNLEEKYKSLEDLMKNYQNIDDDQLKISIREFGGGLINHNFLWDTLKKDVELKDGELKKKIEETWGTLENFKYEFKKISLSLFGSGWVWLVKRSNGDLKIIKTFNQDNPWFLKFKPLLGIDLWEHSYYLKHNSNRANYFEDFWQIINWDKVEENFINED